MNNDRIPNQQYPQYPMMDAQDERRDPAFVDNELQVDPELAEGPASGGRVAMFTVAIALVLGAVFYGLNNSSVDQASTTPAKPISTAQNNTQPPPAPPGMRDVTPRANTESGVTTGAAPAHMQTPPSAAPTGQDVNRSGNPPMDNGAATK